MLKNKVIITIAATFFISFCSSNVSFAEENIESKTVYPNYSLEFAGKDTCEKFNRKLFVFNLKLNKCIVRPVNIVWASCMPKYGMDRVQNAYNNMNYPVRLVSCLVQKDFHALKQESVRFLMNTTLGVGGLYDPAMNHFKIESHQEDMGQALAHLKIKQGPYLVLPVVRGNIRDLVGKLLDCPLRPTSYVGPFGAAANALFAVNNTTVMQPIFKKVDETYPDPYEIAKQIDGIDRFIKNSNLDRSEVFLEKTAAQRSPKIGELSEDSEVEVSVKSDIDTESGIGSAAVKGIAKSPVLKSELLSEIRPELTYDVELSNFNPQGSLVDSFRTAFFDNQYIDSSLWSEMSVWNKTFSKKIKISSVNVFPGRKNYRYRYILQQDKNSPLAILYPSIGEGITADKSVVLAKILYDEGYSVVIQGSSFQWEFINSMPEDYKPGLPVQDARYLRMTSAKIVDDLQIRKNYKFGKRILIGCSFGALTGIFTAEQEQKENTLNISKYIAINPPVEIFYAMRKLDKYTQDWKNDPSDIKMRTAIAAEKIMRVSQNIYHKKVEDMPESMPFNEDEAKLVIGFIMKQKLSDVVFAVEHCTRTNTNDLYTKINNMSFNDYANKYLFVDAEKPISQTEYETSLYSISDFLRNGNNYKIYHTMDDYFVNRGQLAWLKKNSNNKSVFFSNGSHLGFMYRKEFLDEFKKDIKITDTAPVPASGL